MKSYWGEILKEDGELSFNPINGLRRAIAARRKANEVKYYGPVAERLRAYSVTRASFDRFFADNPDKIAQKSSEPLETQISFDWLGGGHGHINRIGEDYTVHIITDPYDTGDSILGKRFKLKHSLIEINNAGAKAQEWVETRTQTPITRSPFISETKPRTMLLTAQEATDLAKIVHTEYIVPTFNSLTIGTDPNCQEWRQKE